MFRIMRILFVCEYNACRSQMAEGLARHLLPPTVSVQSAGLYPGTVHACTIDVMREIGIDISTHRSKQLAAVAGTRFDYLVVLASPASAATRHLHAAQRLDWSYPDPALAVGSPQDVKAAIRGVREALTARIKDYFLP